MNKLYAVAMSAMGLIGTAGSVNGQTKPTNVVLIMADDVSWEAFSCYGAQDYKTPNIDALAQQGVRFENCFSTPLCTPSRVMIMTGKYNFRNYTHFGYLNPKEKTFGHKLQEAGYKTAIAGKWQLNGCYDKHEGYDDATRPFKAGFNEYCLWQLTQEKKQCGERFWSPMLEKNGKVMDKSETQGKYGPDLMADFVMDFMTRHKDQPFFVYYPTLLVHSPFVPTPDTIGDAPRTQAANKSRKGAKAKEHFVSMVEYMDKIIGQIRAKTEELGIAENTMIVFTSDNGTHKSIRSQWNGQTIIGGKGSLTNMGTHVPMVAYQKGRTPEGKVIKDLVDFTDLYPTLAGLAGLEMKENDPIDGYSFLPQLNGEAGSPRKWALCHYQPYWSSGGRGGSWARTADYKLYPDGTFVAPSQDLTEADNLAEKISGERMINTHKMLQKVLKKVPEVPAFGSKNEEKKAKKSGKPVPVYPRPVHPDLPKL